MARFEEFTMFMIWDPSVTIQFFVLNTVKTGCGETAPAAKPGAWFSVESYQKENRVSIRGKI